MPRSPRCLAHHLALGPTTTLLVVVLAACGSSASTSGGGSTGGPGVVTGAEGGQGGGTVAPIRPSGGGPAPMSDPSNIQIPTPSVGSVVPGQRERPVVPRLIRAEGSDLILEIVTGMPPCQAVTGMDVVETSTTVTVTGWVGRTPGATGCDGPQPAIAAIQWIRVSLAAPLGTRSFDAGS